MEKNQLIFKKSNISFFRNVIKQMNELIICLFCFVFRFCITLIQGTNDILFASFCLSLFNAKIFFSWDLIWVPQEVGI